MRLIDADEYEENIEWLIIWLNSDMDEEQKIELVKGFVKRWGGKKDEID